MSNNDKVLLFILVVIVGGVFLMLKMPRIDFFEKHGRKMNLLINSITIIVLIYIFVQ